MPRPPQPGPPDAAEVFSDFVAARGAALQRTAYLLVGERGLAQDLVQEALTRTWAAWPRIKDPQRAEAYTRRAMTNTAISWYRRRSWRGERPSASIPEGAEPTQVGHEDTVGESDRLWRALAALPPRQRAVLVHRFYDDLSEADTARLMGCAPGTVKSQVSAGLKKLRLLVPDLELTDRPHATDVPAPAKEPTR